MHMAPVRPGHARRFRIPFLLSALLSTALLLPLSSCDRQPVASGPPVESSASPDLTVAPTSTGPAVVISQVYGGGGNASASHTHDFVELFNRSSEPVDIGGWRIHYAATAGTSWSNTTTLPAGSLIAPGGYFLVQLFSNGSVGVALPAPDATGTINMAAGAGKVALTSASIALTGECPSDASIVDRVRYGSGTSCAGEWGNTATISGNALAALRNDGGCAWTGSTTPDFTVGTPAPRNSGTPANPCGGGGGGEPALVEVAPATATTHVGTTLQFTANAQDADGQPVGTTFTWSSSDNGIATIDEGTGVATGVAEGTVTITATATNGVAGSAELTVTPAPSGDGNVVISQVYGGGGNANATLTHDFVELFNRGDYEADVSGWLIHYASAAGNFTQNTALPQGSSIPAGGYFLVQLATNNPEVGAALPAPDATGGLNLAAGSGKVALTLPGVTLTGLCPVSVGLMDRVNYGTANCADVWGTTAALSASLAALRNDGGCAYTGNVSNDFTRGPPAPRNSSSQRFACQGPVSVTVAPASAEITAGQGQAFTATGTTADGQPTGASFTWSSSDESIATVDAATGMAAGVAAGTATITATAANGVSGSATLTVTAPPPATGLIITEFLSDPVGADNVGEWFEIYNAGNQNVDLHNWIIHSRSSTGLETHTIGSSVVVPAGGFVVLGNNANQATNGGVPVAYSYGGDIILNNSNTDWFVIKRPDGTTEDSVAYSARSSGDVIGSPQFTPIEGVSRVLIDVNLDNSVAASPNWTNSTLAYGDGRNLGSPGWGAYGTAGPVTSVRVLPENATVLVGGSFTFNSVALDALGRVSSETLTWSSSDNSIATINAATGVASGLVEGSVQITATATSGVQGMATLVVVHPSSPASVVTGISDPNWVPVGYTKRVFATVRDFDGNILTPEVTWSVNDPSLGYFANWDGQRTYFVTTGTGTARITATTANGVSGSSSLTILPGDAPTPAVYLDHVEFGMPTSGGSLDDVIVQKRGFVSSFSFPRGGPNWVSWNINATHFGSVSRCNCFSPDPELPADPRTVVDSDYIGSGYDRGHMVQSESRTTTEQENAATFWFTNILPQAPVNNQQSWLSFENHLNNLARQQNKEVYVIAGGEYSANPRTINNAGKIQIPEFTWKVAVVMDRGKGLADIESTADFEILAVRMPNLNETAQPGPWQNFVTTVAAIEAATGYDLLHLLDERLVALDAGQTPAGTNVAVQPYDPTTGQPGAATITFSNVSAAGVTTVTSGTIGAGDAPPAPTGFQLGSPATYFDIETSALWSAPVTICINYAGVSYSNPDMLRLLHYENGWEDITTLVDHSNTTVCGQASSLSPFLVAEAVPIRFEASATAMTNAPSGNASRQLVIARPAGVAVGDLLLAQVTFEKGTDAGLTAPVGWTLVRRTDRLTDLGQAVFYRIATDSEPVSYTWSFSQSVKAAGGISRYSGVDPENPIVTSSGGSGDSSTLTAPGVDATANSILVSFYGFKKKDTTLSVPMGMEGRYNFQNPQDVTIRAADEPRVSAGATGNRVSRPSPSNSDKWVAQSVVLRRAN